MTDATQERDLILGDLTETCDQINHLDNRATQLMRTAQHYGASLRDIADHTAGRLTHGGVKKRIDKTNQGDQS